MIHNFLNLNQVMASEAILKEMQGKIELLTTRNQAL